MLAIVRLEVVAGPLPEVGPIVIKSPACQPTTEVEQLIHDGAQDLLQAVDPFALASFFFNGPEAGT